MSYSIIIIIVAFLFIVFFVIYKRNMLLKLFSIDAASSTLQFQENLEQTADIVVKRLEEQITHLEYLLEEANEKIISLDNKIKDANNCMENHHHKEVTKRLEEQITHVESLLEEANEKNISLDNKIKDANQCIEDCHKAQEVAEHLHKSILEMTSVASEEYSKVNSDISNNIVIDTTNTDKLSIDNNKNIVRNDKRSSIIEMADLGYDINEIAKITNISKGEIMLLLQLNKK